MHVQMDRSVGTTIFGTDVAGYESGRPAYPEALFAILADRCGLTPGAVILEIGPGTGQATRRLLEMGASRLVAVEPDPALAAHLRSWGVQQLEVEQAGFGPDLGGSQAFDLIVAATSFHWLESVPALATVRRLLRRDGAFAMWWNVFHEAGEDPLFEILFDGLPRPPSLISGHHYSLDTTARCAELAQAGFDPSHVMLSQTLQMTPASLKALFSTFSAVRQLPPAQRAQRLGAVEHAARESLGDRFDRRMRTPLYLARRND